jgi:hypothetical protein
VHDELRDRLLRLNAGLLLPDQAVWLACDLLLAGYETPAVADRVLRFAHECVRIVDARLTGSS